MSFKLDTIRKKVLIFFHDQSQMCGHFFVSTVAQTHPGSESVFEMLSEQRTFLPFEGDSGKLILVHKTNIVMVQTWEGPQEVPGSFDKEVPVTIGFVSGKDMRGRVFFSLPDGRSRMSDFFNTPREFFYFETDVGNFFVQSKFIKLVIPDEEPDIS